MLYQDYKDKINKRVKIRRVLRRYRVPIISAISLIIILIAAFMTTKGMVFGDSLETNKIEYGNKPSFTASAVFSDVRYEFSGASEDKWTTTVPVLMGEYRMRVVANGVFGERFSDEQTFSIVPRRISVVANTPTIVYGEKPGASASLAFDDRVECGEFIFDDSTKQQTNVTPVKSSVKVIDKNGKDVTECYEVGVAPSMITFTKRDITVTVESVTTVYNDEYFSHEAWQITDGSLAYNDDVVKVVDNSFTSEKDAGEVENKGEFRVLRGSVDISHHYNITMISGKLTIEQRPITIHTSSLENVYTGQDWYDPNGYSVDESTPLLDGHSISVSGYNRLSLVGEIDNLYSFIIRDKDGADVTSNYSFTNVCGKIKVLPREITVKTKTEVIEYDGKEHSFGEYEIVSETKLAVGHELKLLRQTSAKNVVDGLENAVDLDVVDGNGNSVLANYTVIYENGTVTITKRDITIESDSLNGTYNGKAQGVESYTLTLSDVCDGHNLDVIFKATVTECQDEAIDNEFDVIIRDENGEKVTDNYAVNKIYGTLKLNPLPIAIITGSAYKVYDGTPLYECSFEYEDGSAQIVSGHRVEYINATEQTDADTVDNVFEIEIYSGEENKSHNYDVSYEYGELDVARRPIVITSASLPENTYYDGQIHRLEEYEISPAEGFNFALVENHEAEIEFLANSYVEFAVEDGNNKPNLFNVVKITDTVTEDDVTGNYAPTQIYGLLRLEKRPIRFESGSTTAIYDGETHYNTECYAPVLDIDPTDPGASLGLVDGHTPDAKFWGTGGYGAIDVGEFVNYFSIHGILDENGNNVYDNYQYNGHVYGKITIEPRPITLISKDDTKMYDGTPLTNTEYSVGGMGLVKDDGLSYSHNATITDVLLDADGNVIGIENSFDFGIVGGRGLASNYIVTGTEFGTLTVTKRPITLTSQDASKIYDGKFLYNDSLLISGEGLVGGDVVECINYAAITDVFLDENGQVSSVQNTFGFNIFKKDGSDAGHNYEVTKEETGRLTVTKRAATVFVNDVSREYDGTPLMPNGFDYTRQSGNTGILDIHTVSMLLTGSITKVGSITISHGAPTVFVNENGELVDKSHNYDITVEDGTLTVTKRKIVLNARVEEQEYTGEVIYPTFTDDDVAYAFDPYGMGLGMGDSITVIFAQGQRTELGTSIVKIKNPDGWTMINKDGEDVTFCYEVTEVNDGSLTIIPRRIFIRLHGNSKEYYDGAAITNDGYTVESFLYNMGHTISLQTSGAQTDYGFSYAQVIESSIVIKDKNGNDASRYYELIGTENGRLEVENKRPITVISASDFFLYDGQPHKNEGYEILDNCPYPMQRAEDYFVTFTNDIMVLPGEYENKLTVQMFISGTSTETTYNYDIIYQYGAIIISGVDIEITTGGGEKIYDGTPLTNSTADYNCPNGMPSGLEIQIVPTGSQTDAGTSANTYEIVATINGSPFPIEGFNILKEELGELKVTPLEIIISTESGETVYSGVPFVHNVYTSNFVDTESLKLYVQTAMLTDIGEKPNDVISVDLFDANGVAVSRDNFTWSVEDVGMLTMYADLITVESKSDRFFYDGTSKSCPGNFPPGGHINPKHKLVTSGYKYFVDVGEHENVFTTVDVLDEDGNSVIRFYPNIERIYNKVIIDKRQIEIEAPSIVERYENGKVIYAPNEIVMPNEYLDELNDNIFGYEYGYGIDCNMAEIAFATELGVDVEYYIPIEHFYITLNGERLDMNNFDVTCLPGILRFSDKLVEIEIFEVNGYYDGNRLEYFADDWDIADDQLPDGCWLDLDLSGIGLSEAGVIDFDEMLEYLLTNERLFVYRYNEAGMIEDMTHLFEFKLVGTPLTLNKAELILTAGSSSKVYDGNPLTNNTYIITGGGLEDGHVIEECVIVGSITEVGYELNEIIDVVIVDLNDRDSHGIPRDITDNYHIKVIDGVLTVTEDKDK